MTPKSLLRHPFVASSLSDLAEGSWQPVIDDDKAQKKPDKIHRLILCSGKVYVDLVSSELRDKNPDTALVRVEQLYPLPKSEIKEAIGKYAKLKELVWLQEEPENMGVWRYIAPRLKKLSGGLPIHYIGRRALSSPAEGSSSHHKINQDALIEQAYSKSEIARLKETDIIWLKNT
jgi:2-oxoglutarate dehydrogenase E1 component